MPQLREVPNTALSSSRIEQYADEKKMAGGIAIEMSDTSYLVSIVVGTEVGYYLGSCVLCELCY